MKRLNFFNQNKKYKSESVKTHAPSPEQILFTNTILEIISPAVEQFGFMRHLTEIKRYSSRIIFRKENLYILIKSSTYPTDYPYHYNIILGEGSSDDPFEQDWDSTALWSLKSMINPLVKAKEYEFPSGDHVKFSIMNARKELLQYGISFLNGDLTLFLKTRSAQNQSREPYKIHSPDVNGKYTTINEPRSVDLKQKFS